jgi:hypothetical protein
MPRNLSSFDNSCLEFGMRDIENNAIKGKPMVE